MDCADDSCAGEVAIGSVCEYGVETLCADGFDNDADGLADALDPDCNAPEGQTSTAECNDGIDNDLDGLYDADDPDYATYCTPTLLAEGASSVSFEATGSGGDCAAEEFGLPGDLTAGTVLFGTPDCDALVGVQDGSESMHVDGAVENQTAAWDSVWPASSSQTVVRYYWRPETLPASAESQWTARCGSSFCYPAIKFRPGKQIQISCDTSSNSSLDQVDPIGKRYGLKVTIDRPTKGNTVQVFDSTGSEIASASCVNSADQAVDGFALGTGNSSPSEESYFDQADVWEGTAANPIPTTSPDVAFTSCSETPSSCIEGVDCSGDVVVECTVENRVGSWTLDVDLDGDLDYADGCTASGSTDTLTISSGCPMPTTQGAHVWYMRATN